MIRFSIVKGIHSCTSNKLGEQKLGSHEPYLRHRFFLYASDFGDLTWIRIPSVGPLRKACILRPSPVSKSKEERPLSLLSSSIELVNLQTNTSHSTSLHTCENCRYRYSRQRFQCPGHCSAHGYVVDRVWHYR